MRGEIGDVLAALLEARHAERDDGEAVEQILAEAPAGDLALEVAVGGGEHADIDAHAR